MDLIYAYVVHLSGMGDTTICLVNAKTFKWINEGGDIPEDLIENFIKANSIGDEDMSRDDAIAEMMIDDQTSSPENDRALAVTPSMFGEASYYSDDLNVNEINKFAKANDLVISDESYTGQMY